MASHQLSEGAEVYSSDGKKLGREKHFFSAAPDLSHEATVAEVSAVSARTNDGIMPTIDDTPRSAYAPGPGPGVDLGPSDTKYMEVHHGGHLHIGGESVYVPFSAIDLVEEDGSVMLRCTADEV